MYALIRRRIDNTTAHTPEKATFEENLCYKIRHERIGEHMVNSQPPTRRKTAPMKKE